MSLNQPKISEIFLVCRYDTLVINRVPNGIFGYGSVHHATLQCPPFDLLVKSINEL